MQSLDTALKQGYDRYHVIATDSDLDWIRQDSKFSQIIRNRYAEIVRKYHGLLETGGNTHQALHVLAWVQLFSNERSQVLEGVEYAYRALSGDPENSAYLGTLAELYAASGNYKLALEKIKLAIDKDPTRFYFLELRKLWKKKRRPLTPQTHIFRKSEIFSRQTEC